MHTCWLPLHNESAVSCRTPFSEDIDTLSMYNDTKKDPRNMLYQPLVSFKKERDTIYDLKQSRVSYYYYSPNLLWDEMTDWTSFIRAPMNGNSTSLSYQFSPFISDLFPVTSTSMAPSLKPTPTLQTNISMDAKEKESDILLATDEINAPLNPPMENTHRHQTTGMDTSVFFQKPICYRYMRSRRNRKIIIGSQEAIEETFSMMNRKPLPLPVTKDISLVTNNVEPCVKSIHSASAKPEDKKESKKPEGIHQKRQKLYKTELCRNWEEIGQCRYGAKCQYAHGVNDLHTVERHPKYKTQICRTYYTTGTCPYGIRCTFLHEESKGDGKESSQEDKSMHISKTCQPTSLFARDGSESNQTMLGAVFPLSISNNATTTNTSSSSQSHSRSQSHGHGHGHGTLPIDLSVLPQKKVPIKALNTDYYQRFTTASSCESRQDIFEIPWSHRESAFAMHDIRKNTHYYLHPMAPSDLTEDIDMIFLPRDAEKLLPYALMTDLLSPSEAPPPHRF